MKNRFYPVLPRKSWLVTICCCCPISKISLRRTKLVHTFVHARCPVLILDYHSICFAVVDTKSKISFILRDETIGDAHSACCGSDFVNYKHLVYLLLFEIGHLKLCTVLGWVYWSVIGHFVSHLVLHQLNRTKVSVRFYLKLCEPIHKYVANIQIFFG